MLVAFPPQTPLFFQEKGGSAKYRLAKMLFTRKKSHLLKIVSCQPKRLFSLHKQNVTCFVIVHKRKTRILYEPTKFRKNFGKTEKILERNLQIVNFVVI